MYKISNNVHLPIGIRGQGSDLTFYDINNAVRNCVLLL